MDPFPQIGYVTQNVSAGGFWQETVICGNDNGALKEGELQNPICEEERKERGAGNLLSLFSINLALGERVGTVKFELLPSENCLRTKNPP